MSDVFISYARSTAKQAQQVADALRSLGYGVWRDDELPAHRDYSEVIEERLRAAKAVVVVWSADAVKSQWVRAEADLARETTFCTRFRIAGSLSASSCFHRAGSISVAAIAPDSTAPSMASSPR